MKYQLILRHNLDKLPRILHILFHNVQQGILVQTMKVLHSPCRKIVDNSNPAISIQQFFRQMASNEPSAPRHNNPAVLKHVYRPPLSGFLLLKLVNRARETQHVLPQVSVSALNNQNPCATLCFSLSEIAHQLNPCAHPKPLPFFHRARRKAVYPKKPYSLTSEARALFIS
jgi:hypothetical protein